MNIPTAIKILEEDKQGDYEGTELDRYDAISLGIEALERVKGNRLYPQPTVYPLLPGETEE